MDQDNKIWAQVSRYSGLALLLPTATVMGYFIGYLLDKLFHTHFLYIVFLILGIVAGFVSLLRELNAATKADER